MGAVPSSSMFAVFKAVQWDNYGLVVVDSAMSYSIIDILMGGPRGVGHAGVETRPHTAIERALIEKLITLTLNDLSIAFNPVCNVDLTFERLEVSSRFAAIARASNAVVLAKLHIDMEDRTGNMDLIIPYATLEPVRDQLSQQFMGEKFGRDSIWEDHLFSEILETDAQVSAVFDEKIVPLSEVLNLKIGSLMTFPHKQGAPSPSACNAGRPHCLMAVWASWATRTRSRSSAGWSRRKSTTCHRPLACPRSTPPTRSKPHTGSDWRIS